MLSYPEFTYVHVIVYAPELKETNTAKVTSLQTSCVYERVMRFCTHAPPYVAT